MTKAELNQRLGDLDRNTFADHRRGHFAYATEKLTISEVRYVCGHSLENFAGTALSGPVAGTLAVERFIRRSRCPKCAGRPPRRRKRQSPVLTHDGRTQTIREWARECGFNAGVIESRLQRGWTVAAALTTSLKQATDPRHQTLALLALCRELHAEGLSLELIASGIERRLARTRELLAILGVHTP